MKRILGVAATCLIVAAVGNVMAATIGADMEVLTATPALARGLPPAREFVIVTAGQVEVRLADLAAPATFANLRLVLTRNGTRVARLDAAGSIQFAAQPGNYKVQVLGAAAAGAGAGAGTFSVEVRTVSSGAILFQFSDGMLADPPANNPNRSIMDTTFTVAQAGTYTVTLTDRSFPVALSRADLIVLSSGSAVLATLGPCAGAPCSASFVAASPGTYDLNIVADATGSDQAGLYSVSIVGGPSAASVYVSTQAVGQLPAALPLMFPVGGAATLTATDFVFPAALSAFRALAVQGATSLGQLTLAIPAVTGSVPLNGVVAGSGQLFVFSRANSPVAGSYGLKLMQGTQAILEDAHPVPEGYVATAALGGYRYSANIATAGNYQLQLRDYAFPNVFSSLRVAVSQGGVLTQSLAAAGTTTVPLAAGPVSIVVSAKPISAASNSLFGLSLSPATGAAVVTGAQGVGGLFSTRTGTIPTAGSYDLTLNDLGFPVNFGELAVAVTQGTNLVGQIFGGGKISFTGTPGVYSLNVLAQLSAGSNYGSYGYELATTPPLPTATLTASPAAVNAQQATQLQWSSTDATVCTASGGWSGSRSLSGIETSPILTADSTFTLNCTGPGGSVSRSVSVTVTASGSGSSGGGMLSGPWTLGLGLLALWQQCRRRQGEVLVS